MKKIKEFDIVYIAVYGIFGLIIGAVIFKLFYSSAIIVAPVYLGLGAGLTVWVQKIKIYFTGIIHVAPRKKQIKKPIKKREPKNKED